MLDDDEYEQNFHVKVVRRKNDDAIVSTQWENIDSVFHRPLHSPFGPASVLYNPETGKPLRETFTERSGQPINTRTYYKNGKLMEEHFYRKNKDNGEKQTKPVPEPE